MTTTDWSRIENVLDDRSTAHGCAFCGERIAIGDDERWGLAIRQPSGNTSVVWCHPSCLTSKLVPSVRRVYEARGPSAGTG